MIEILRHLIEANLSIFLFDNAKFYAERLYYEDPCEAHLHLLAQCHFRQGKIKQTYLILQGSTSSDNRYLFALACISINKLQEAEMALLGKIHSQPLQSFTAEQGYNVPGQAAGVYLLGLICKKQQRKDSAIEFLKLSLKMDPTLWTSVTELSELGVLVDVADLFGMNVESACATINGIKQDNNRWKQEGDICKDDGDVFATRAYAGNTRGVTASSTSTAFRNAIDKNKLIENLSKSYGSPRTAVSLGLSSLSLRIPFASPGTILASLPSSAARGRMGGVSTQDAMGNGNISMSSNGPLGASDLFFSGRGRSDDTMSTAFDDSRGPQAQLFDLSTPSSRIPSLANSMSMTERTHV